MAGQGHHQADGMFGSRDGVAGGALTTMIPRWVAAFTSILSMPTPARPITISFLPASITWAVTVEALRTINPS